MARISGITIEIGGDTTKLESALKGVNSTIKSTQNQLKDVEKLLKLDPKNTELLRQKQKLLGNQIQNTKQKLDTLKEAQKQMDASGVDKNSEQYMALQREIIDTEDSLKRLERQLEAVSSEAGTAGSGMESFQNAMQNVSSKADAVAQATAAAAEKTRALSTAAAGALAALLGAGYKAATTADDLNTLAKQTGFTTEELQMMQYAADRIDVPMEAITKAAKKMTKQLINSEDKFSDLGIATRDSAGNFRSTSDIFYDTIEALSHIENETERDMIAMELFGMSANELAGIIDDGGEALREFGDEAKEAGLILDQETLDGLNEVNDEIDRLKAMGAATIAKVGARALQALTPVLEKVAQKVERLLEFIGNLSPKALGIIMSVLGIVAALSPMLMMVSKVSKGISLFTGGLAKLAPALAGIGGPVLAIVAVIAVLTAAFVHLWKTNEKFRSKMTSIWKGLVGKFKSFGDQLLTRINALGFSFSSITEALSAAWNTFCDALGPVIEVAFEVISTVIGTALDYIIGLIDFWKSVFTGDWRGAWEAIKNIAQSIVSGIRSVISTYWNAMKDDAVQIWTSICETAGRVWNSIKSAVSDGWNTVVTTLTIWWNSIKEFASESWRAIQSTAKTVWSSIVNAVTDGWSVAVSTLVSWWNSIKEFASESWRAIQSTASTVWGSIVSSVSSGWDTACTTLVLWWNQISQFASESWQAIKVTAKTVWDGIKSAITDPIGAAEKILQGAETWEEMLKNAWEGIKGMASTTWNNIKTTIASKFAGARARLSLAASGIRSMLSGNWDSVNSDAGSKFDTIKSTVSQKWDAIRSSIMQKWASIRTALTSPFENAKSTIDGIVNTIKGWFPINIGNILSGFKLPHFTLKMAPMTILGKTYEIPKGFDVQWYAKAMDNAWILSGASIFGAMGGRLLGGGEAGKEVVVSYDKLAQMMGGGGDQIEINVTINAAHVQNDAALAEMVARRIQDAVVRKGAVWA